jgi:hypothetical protein
MSWIVYAERDGGCADYGWLLLSVHGDRLDAELEAAALRREAAEWRQAWRERPGASVLVWEAAEMLAHGVGLQACHLLSGVDVITFHAGTVGTGRL